MTDINVITLHKKASMPFNPVTGETALDDKSNLVIWTGSEWKRVAGISDVINNVGYNKANAILNQVFTDEVVRDKVPAVKLAFEHYQTLLALAYSEKDN